MISAWPEARTARYAGTSCLRISRWAAITVSVSAWVNPVPPAFERSAMIVSFRSARLYWPSTYGRLIWWGKKIVWRSWSSWSVRLGPPEAPILFTGKVKGGHTGYVSYHGFRIRPSDVFRV